MTCKTVNDEHAHPICWLLLYACVCFSIGCRQEPTTVQGLVTLNGKPLAMREGMRGTVVYQPTSRAGAALNGVIDSAGRYTLSAGSSSVVVPSVYWVTVSASELVPPRGDQLQTTGRRITPAKYASATDSGFRIEVLPGANEVDLALKSDLGPRPESGDELPAEPAAAVPQ